MSQPTTSLAVRKEIVVDATVERAWAVFTDGFAGWWPTDSHTVLEVETETAVIEPFAGGRWYERGVDGSECDWGRVAVWEPPVRLVLTWQLTATWQYDPHFETTVEVRFSDAGGGRTRVEVEHRGLEAFGDEAEGMVGVFSSEGGWGGLIVAYGAQVDAG